MPAGTHGRQWGQEGSEGSTLGGGWKHHLSWAGYPKPPNPPPSGGKAPARGTSRTATSTPPREMTGAQTTPPSPRRRHEVGAAAYPGSTRRPGQATPRAGRRGPSSGRSSAPARPAPGRRRPARHTSSASAGPCCSRRRTCALRHSATTPRQLFKPPNTPPEAAPAPAASCGAGEPDPNSHPP